MIDLALAIALTCHVGTVQDLGGATKQQQECHAFYSKCTQKYAPKTLPKDWDGGREMLECMVDRWKK